MYYRPRKNIHSRLHKQTEIVVNHLSTSPKIFEQVPNRKKSIISAFLLLMCFTHIAMGDTKIEKKNQEEDAPPTISYLNQFEPEHKYISQQILDFADMLDTFFTNDRAYDELQDSHVNLLILHTNADNKKPGYRAQLRAKIVFPKTQKKLKLLIESQGQDEETQQSSLTEALQSQEQSLGLRFIERETMKWRVQTDVGLRFKSGVDIFTRLRLRRLITSDTWIYRISQTFYWYRTDGAGETTRLDIDHSLAKDLLFRATSQATWLNKNNYFDLEQDFTLFQKFNKRKAISYQTGILRSTEPHTQSINYFLSTRYRQEVHRNWLFFEINPGVNYPENNSYKPIKFIILKLEAVFGSL
jgi:hypothetical protein